MNVIRTAALSLAAAALLVAPALAGSPQKGDKFGTLTIEQVEQGIAKKELAVFDSNGKDRFDKGHLPGAKWMPQTEVKAEALPADKAAKLVFYCGGVKCMAAPQAARKVVELGYTNVYVMPDGISGWEKAGKPVEKGAGGV